MDSTKLIMKYKEKPISESESKYSKRIRECLINRNFDELYSFLPKEIAMIINQKYRVLEPIVKSSDKT